MSRSFGGQEGSNTVPVCAYGYGSVEMAARAGNNVDGETEAEGGRGRGSDEGKGEKARKEVLRLMEREAWRS